MSYKQLLDRWSKEHKPRATTEAYAVNLSLEDAARIHAFAELFPGTDRERIITDLLSLAVRELEAAIPYVAGEKVIREDDQGDPIYEDVGLTPQFLQLLKKYQAEIETS